MRGVPNLGSAAGHDVSLLYHWQGPGPSNSVREFTNKLLKPWQLPQDETVRRDSLPDYAGDPSEDFLPLEDSHAVVENGDESLHVSAGSVKLEL